MDSSDASGTPSDEGNNSIEHWVDHFTPYDDDLAASDRSDQVLDSLREKCPVFNSDQHGGFKGVTRHEDVRQVNLDDDTFSHFPCTVVPFGNERPMIPIENDGDLHREYRRVLNPYFSREAVADWEPELRDMMRRRIDGFIDEGRCDFAEEIAVPVPRYVLMEMLGVPEEDRPQLAEWAMSLTMREGELEDPEAAEERAQRAIEGMSSYMQDKIEERRADPGEDIVSHLLDSQVFGRDWTDEEIIDFCNLLFPAGFDTTTSAIGNSMVYLAENPHVRDQLAANPELIEEAVDEMLRLAGPVKVMARRVEEETEFRGTNLEPGETLAVVYGSSNRDPRVFDEPDTFKPERSPNPHHAFGSGPHLCLGIHLARLEMQVVFEETLRAIPHFELDGEPDLHGGTNWGPTSLPIRWDLDE